MLRIIGSATDSIAEAAMDLFADPPVGLDTDRLATLATRGRSLLARGTGRLTIYAIGRRLGIDDERSLSEAFRRLLEVKAR